MPRLRHNDWQHIGQAGGARVCWCGLDFAAWTKICNICDHQSPVSPHLVLVVALQSSRSFSPHQVTQYRAEHTPEQRAGGWAGQTVPAAMVRPLLGPRDPVYPAHAAHLATPCRRSSRVALCASRSFIVEWCRCGFSHRSCRLRSPIPSIDRLIEFTAELPVK